MWCIFLSVAFLGAAQPTWGLPTLLISGDEKGLVRLMKTSETYSPRLSEFQVKWPYSISYDEKNLSKYLELVDLDPFLNQSFTLLSPREAGERWLASSAKDVKLVLIESYPYEPEPAQRPPWETLLMNKTLTAASHGGTVLICGRAWAFARHLAEYAGVDLSFYDTPFFERKAVDVLLNPDMARILGKGPMQMLFGSDDGLLPVAGVGLRVLLEGRIGTKHVPLAVEFSLDKGTVIYSAVTVESNLMEGTPPQGRRVVRELLARPLKAQAARYETKRLAGVLSKQNPQKQYTVADLDSEGADVQELLFCASRRMEVRCNLEGNVSLILTPLEFTSIGMDLSNPSPGVLNILDVSLYAPDGRLFERKKVNGTSVIFNIPDGRKKNESPWTLQLNQANGFAPRRLFMAIFASDTPNWNTGDPGHDSRAHLAHLNFISSDQDNVILRGASNPASLDIFVGGKGRTTCVGGTGDNIYSWETEGGHYTIVNGAGKKEPSGMLWLGGPMKAAMTQIRREGQNLVITLRDDAKKPLGSVTVRDWFANSAAKLQVVAFEHGPELQWDEIEAWGNQPGGEIETR